METQVLLTITHYWPQPEHINQVHNPISYSFKVHLYRNFSYLENGWSLIGRFEERVKIFMKNEDF